MQEYVYNPLKHNMFYVCLSLYFKYIIYYSYLCYNSEKMCTYKYIVGLRALITNSGLLTLINRLVHFLITFFNY